jgi:hypothetical protein
MYRPNSRYGNVTPTASDQTAGSDARLVECALLLDLGFAAASVVAFGVLDLITPTSGATWLAVLAIALGGTAAYVLWRRAGRILEADDRVTQTPPEHGVAIGDVQRRVLTHPFAR